MASLTRGPRVLQTPFRLHLPSTRPLSSKPSVSHRQRFTTSAASQASKRDQSKSPPPPTTHATTVTTPSAHEINAPTSTLPAEINIPSPLPPTAEITAKIKRLIALGRAYVSFYKTGLKNVFHNYRASLPLRKTLGLPLYIPISPPRRVSSSNGHASHAGLTMGRAQFQLVRRSARDVRRMIPFTLILIICGEFTPLVIPMFGSAITPATCRVPGQIAKERDTASRRKYTALLAHVRATAGNGTALESVQVGSERELGLLAGFADPVWLAGADANAVLCACAVFGLVKSHERMAGSALVALIYRRRLRRYLEYLSIDDGMIRAGGGVAALSPAEVRIALEERGAGDVAALHVGKKAEIVGRKWLERWLDVREGEVLNQTGKKRIL